MTDKRSEFVARYGGIYESSPWVAERAFERLESADQHDIEQTLRTVVDEAASDEKLALIRAHPDLAGRAAVAGQLTAESTSEQASAGLDQCTPQEFERFQALNASYRERFGFPFIMAVRNSTRADILASFEARLQHSPEQEFETAIHQVHEIARLRLQAL